MKTNILVSQFITFFFFLFIFSSFTLAQTAWTADAVGGDTDWEKAANWTNGVPQPGEVATIPGCSNCPIISTPDQEVAYVQLFPGGKLTISQTGSLTIERPVGPGLKSQANTEIVILAGGQLKVQNFLGSGIEIGGKFENYGTVAVDGGPTGIFLGAGATLINYANASLSIQGANLNYGLFAFGTVLNNGEIKVEGAQKTGVYLENESISNLLNGSIDISSPGATGLFAKNADLINTGLLTVEDGVYGINLNNTTFNNQSGGQVRLKGPNFLSTGLYSVYSRLVNEGLLTIDQAYNRGIDQSTASEFHNHQKIEISGNSLFGVFNSGGAIFVNHPCARIETSSPVVDYANFTNNGIIVEESNGSSQVALNEGHIFNLTGGTFTVATGFAPLNFYDNVWLGCVDQEWSNPANWTRISTSIYGDIVLTIPDVSKSSGRTPVLSGQGTDLGYGHLNVLNLLDGAMLTVANNGLLSFSSHRFWPGPMTLGTDARLEIRSNGAVRPWKIINQGGSIRNEGFLEVFGVPLYGGGIFNEAGTINNLGTLNNSELINNGTCLNSDKWGNHTLTNNGTFSNGGILAGDEGIAIRNNGTFSNSRTGQIMVKDVVKGIVSAGPFYNGGSVKVDGTTELGIEIMANSIFSNGLGANIDVTRTEAQSIFAWGTLENAGNIYVYNTSNSGLVVLGNCTNYGTGLIRHQDVRNGMVSFNNFINYGQVYIEDSFNRGLETGTNGSIINKSGARIEVSGTRTEGIAIFDELLNEGQIRILDAGTTGFVNLGNTVNNGQLESEFAGTDNIANWESLINRGTIRSVQPAHQGIYNLNGYIENRASGQIFSSAAGQNGLDNRAPFYNSGMVEIQSAGTHGLFNVSGGIFNNHPCAELTLTGARFENAAIFNNEGRLTVDDDEPAINTGVLKNTGVIDDPQNGFAGVSYNNEGIRIRPLSGVEGSPVAGALEAGMGNNIGVSTIWYSDMNLSIPAGNYDLSGNTFTPLFGAGTYQLFFEYTNPLGPCTGIASVELTINNNINFRSSDPEESKPGVIIGNYPNPFAETTDIFFSVPFDTEGKLMVFNTKGQAIDILFDGLIEKDKVYRFGFTHTGQRAVNLTASLIIRGKAHSIPLIKADHF